MSFFRYCILLLFTIIGLVSIVSAPSTISNSGHGVNFIPGDHDHEITGQFDPNEEDEIVFGGWVMDTVTSKSGGTAMRFEWLDPSGDLRKRTIVHQVLKYNGHQVGEDDIYYVDVLPSADFEGLWSIVVTEARKDEMNWRSDATFTVAVLPEYSSGSFISLFFAGVLYFLMRRVIGPVNVN